MASLGRPFKPPTTSYLARGKMPSTLGRTLSNSSDLSSSSLPDESGDILILSGSNTPLQENVPSPRHGMGDSIDQARTPEGLCSSQDDVPALAGKVESVPTASQRLMRSRPIAIEMPNTRTLKKTGSACTPPEPLSARGDIPGGYFPHHEDPNARVHRPHPFHLDARLARHHSISLAAESTTSHGSLNTALPNLTPSAQSPVLGAVTAAGCQARATTTAHVTSGLNDSPLSMGKYYPSNYEKRQQSQKRRPAAAGFTTFAKSESQIPTRGSKMQSLQDSEVKLKLQQYQRDMVAQATLAANRVLGKTVKLSSTLNQVAALKGTPPRATLHLGTAGLCKPLSPRLLPLGSPGPVTPMELESGAGSYLDKGRPPSARTAHRQEGEYPGGAIVEEKLKRQDSRSPTGPGVSPRTGP